MENQPTQTQPAQETPAIQPPSTQQPVQHPAQQPIQPSPQPAQVEVKLQPVEKVETVQVLAPDVEQAVVEMLTKDVPEVLKPFLPNTVKEVKDFLTSDVYLNAVKAIVPPPTANPEAPKVEPPPVSQGTAAKTFQNANLKAFDSLFEGML